MRLQKDSSIGNLESRVTSDIGSHPELKIISMSNPELALLRQQMALLETRVKYLEKLLQQQWVTSSKAAQIFAGKMSSYQIRKVISHAIAKPEDSLLIAGTHFPIFPNSDGDDLSQLEGNRRTLSIKSISLNGRNG